MQAGTALLGRRLLAAFVAVMLVASVMFLLAGPAQADHIPDTGQLPDNCVEFQEGDTGTESPVGFPDVDITVDSWDDTPADPHTVDFTISGLSGGEYVDLSVKSGTGVQEPGPYGNGSHTFSNEVQNAISHVRLCVFVQDTTTTTVEDTTTTTVEDTTTTTVEDTTTTTIEDEVLPTTITTLATTTTVADEVLDEEVLPFTGVDTDMLALLAGSLGLLGGMVLLATRRVEE